MESLGLLKTPKKQETKCLEKDLQKEIKMELKSNTDKDFEIQNKKILKRIEDSKKAKEEREQNQEVSQEKTNLAKVIRLPVWPEAVRAVPNGMLRSSLFGAIAKGRRRYINGEKIAAIDGIEIHYKGERLDQGDLDVWESVLHSVRLQDMGSQCRLTSYALLKMMGKTDTGKNRSTLQARIERLVANALTVKQGRYLYMGNLIAGATKDEVTQEWVIELNPKLRPLFAADQFTQIEWAVRYELNGKPLAQWLHGFYSSHAKPFPIKVETLHRLCGSEAKRMSDYKIDLRRNLDSLAKASAIHGERFSYRICGDLVHIEKKVSESKLKPLIKKGNK
jgi:hypothetical protein